MIHDIFIPMDDKFYDVHDVALLHKAHKALYEGIGTNILFFILLLKNLKVLNAF